jgi:hypothetical protein
MAIEKQCLSDINIDSLISDKLLANDNVGALSRNWNENESDVLLPMMSIKDDRKELALKQYKCHINQKHQNINQ